MMLLHTPTRSRPRALYRDRCISVEEDMYCTGATNRIPNENGRESTWLRMACNLRVSHATSFKARTRAHTHTHMHTRFTLSRFRTSPPATLTYDLHPFTTSSNIHHTMPHYTTLHHTTLRYTTPYHTIPCRTIPAATEISEQRRKPSAAGVVSTSSVLLASWA